MPNVHFDALKDKLNDDKEWEKIEWIVSIKSDSAGEYIWCGESSHSSLNDDDDDDDDTFALSRGLADIYLLPLSVRF